MAIILGEKPSEKINCYDRTVYLEDIEKSQVLGYLGVSAPAINYRDFKVLKSRGDSFYLEVERFGDEN